MSGQRLTSQMQSIQTFACIEWSSKIIPCSIIKFFFTHYCLSELMLDLWVIPVSNGSKTIDLWFIYSICSEYSSAERAIQYVACVIEPRCEQDLPAVHKYSCWSSNNDIGECQNKILLCQHCLILHNAISLLSFFRRYFVRIHHPKCTTQCSPMLRSSRWLFSPCEVNVEHFLKTLYM